MYRLSRLRAGLTERSRLERGGGTASGHAAKVFR
jgi:hypothetical protein